MKKSILLILSVLVVYTLTGQTKRPVNSEQDPFCRMVKTLLSIDALSFDSQLKAKQVFEKDTVTSKAKVIVSKKGLRITYLQIIPEQGDKELLFCNDTSWITDHHLKTITCMGLGIDQLSHNGMSEFFPFSIYNIDTNICLVDPFWKTLNKTADLTTISVDITNAAPELSDIRVEYSIGNKNFLPYKTLQEVLYMKADNLFQEADFSGYAFPEPDEVKIPGYFYTYSKDFSLVRDTLSTQVKKAEESKAEIYLKDPGLNDLSGKPFNLPQDGLIFFDLWYVGCPPCMKSAPVIEKIYNEYKGRVYFFSVNEIDKDTAKIARFKEKMNITFPVLIGGKDKIGEKVTGCGAYPVFILIDAESGKVLWSLKGYSENLEDVVKEAIRQNL